MADILATAEISYDVAVIPASPLIDQIVSAGQAIADAYENRYLIDYETFPPHLSLQLGGTDQKYIELLSTQLQRAIAPFLSSQLIAERLYLGSRGFIGLSCAQDATLMSLVRTVIDACALLHRQHPLYRPRVLERWPYLSKERLELLRNYGTDKFPPHWKPHFSLAEVAEESAPMALHVASQFLQLPQAFTIQTIQLVDVGHQNERWNVLSSWSGSN